MRPGQCPIGRGQATAFIDWPAWRTLLQNRERLDHLVTVPVLLVKRSHVKEMSGVMVFDIPAGTMKARSRHVLPMSDVLVELIERRQAAADSAFLFPAPNKPSSPWCTNQKVLAHIAGRVGISSNSWRTRRACWTCITCKPSLPALERSMEAVSWFIFEKATAPSRRNQRRVRERLLANAPATGQTMQIHE